MRLACRLRELRAPRSLRDLAEETGLNRGALSRIERGQELPRDEWIETLERAYGAPVEEWFDRRTLLVLVLEDDEKAA